MGKWIAAVGILHSLGGLLIYSKGWSEVLNNGLVAGIRDYDITGTTFWFTIAGLILILLGLLLDWVERQAILVPGWFKWSFALLVAALIVPMPITGAWLLLPPAVGLFLARGRTAA